MRRFTLNQTGRTILNIHLAAFLFVLVSLFVVYQSSAAEYRERDRFHHHRAIVVVHPWPEVVVVHPWHHHHRVERRVIIRPIYPPPYRYEKHHMWRSW